MLRSLSIRNIVLVERLDLAFEADLNVLTGETGAGKSILLDALGVALGARAGAGFVREGAAQGSAAALFDISDGHAAHQVLEDAGLDPAAEGELLLRRVISADGRTRGFVNDQPTGVATLRLLGDLLLETHGQHDDRGLLNPAGHRALLDNFAGAEKLLADVRSAWGRSAALTTELTEARAAHEAAARDREFLTHSVDELSVLDPQPGEDDALDAERRLMQAAERIRDEVATAAEAMGLHGAEGMMGDALRRLNHVAEQAEGRLDDALGALDRAMTELGEAQAGVSSALEALTHDPMRLDNVEERLFALRGVARKHRVAPDDLPGLSAGFAARLEAIEGGDDRIATLETALAEAQAAYRKAADVISARRRKAAAELDKAVSGELAPLKMDRARFMTQVSPLAEDQHGPDGADRVVFQVATNPGARPGPIDKIASGGELSRFLLALKVCLSRKGEALSLIFDEIDRGVGGATADAVGQRLAHLAAEGQVLVVTHSPQVAARAAHHWLIAKRAEGDETRVDASRLDEDQRIDEIARMISGANITVEARSAAKALLSG